MTARLDGLATENEILIAIDRAKPSAKTPDPSVDIDRDGQNDAYVEPMTKTAKVDVPSADIYEKADKTSKKLGSLAKGAGVRIIGKASVAWLAIEYNGGTAFAQVSVARPGSGPAMRRGAKNSKTRRCLAFQGLLRIRDPVAAEPLDLLRELRKLKPVVVQFSGHRAQAAAMSTQLRPPARQAMTHARKSVRVVAQLT